MKRSIVAIMAAFAAIFVLDFIAHGRLLIGLYAQTASVWRPEAQAHEKMWLMMLGQLLFAVLFVWIYSKGYEQHRPGLGQGLRYGLLIGLLTSISYITVWYVVLPVPLALALGWFASMMADCLLAGAAVGLLYLRD